ncbi:hypothetical protein [Endozoicomonas sp. 8E]|uniref:hypothetical protein n=1 Tax=Endozoicomonas sp. 8E TaxID=3035692 RepID=UPI002938E739|nr:hypothetical protein [Endozoicomonas sp. 8E]WOG30062.1 hypothetical protein P6910_10525 [Endozoicomonas sp. 8E]
MTKLQYYLACLIAPVLLLQALILQAQNTTQSPIVTASAPPLQTELCEQLSPQTMGVDAQLNLYSNLVYNRQCIVLKANPTENLNKLIERIPENTVILLSSETALTPASASASASASTSATTSASATTTAPANVTSSSSMNMTSSSVVQSNSTTAMPSPSTTSVPGKTPVEYFIDGEIRLKDGQDILGAANIDFEIVIRDRPGFTGSNMVRIGAPDNFLFGERRESNIRHVTFKPSRENNLPLIDSIVFAECYNRRLILEENVFHLPVRAAVNLDCKIPLNLSATYWYRGPGLQFANNTVIGRKYTRLHNRILSNLIPDQGILINLPAIRNQSRLLAVIGNTFQGDMAEAAEFRLGPKITMDVFKNTVDISNDGITRLDPLRKGGFVLVGTADNETRYPVFYLIGNQIKTTQTALTISGRLGMSMVCNHLQAVKPWWQPLERFGLKIFHITLGDAAKQKLCEKVVSSPSVWPIPTQTTMNIWNAISGSTANACAGLVNLKDQLFFVSEVCQPVSPPRDSVASFGAFFNAFNVSSAGASNSSSTVMTALHTSSSTNMTDVPTSSSTNRTVLPTSSAGKAALTTALGIMTTLAILTTL